MLAVRINQENFEYDVNALVKSFYPEETVGIVTPLMGEEKRRQLEPYVRMELVFCPESSVVMRFSGRLQEPDGKMAALEAVQYMQEGKVPPDSQSCETVSQETAKTWETTDREDTSGSPKSADAAEDDWIRIEWRFEPAFPEDSYKAGFKRFLYEQLCRITGRTLPWGNLTGIRPTKIAYGLLEEGKSDEEVLSHLQDRYRVSEEKSRLSIQIARRERELLSGIHYEKGYSLYIGIPFCPTTCLYCSFTSYPIGVYRKETDAYVDCLIREMEYVAGRYRDRILDTVYVGGGTPTTLEEGQLRRLLGAVRSLFDFSQVKEFTVEAGRPDSITAGKLKALLENGVTRISVNPQTMNQRTLDLIGRRHTVEQTKDAFHMAREVGFSNINMDLILGLPGEGAEEVRHTIEEVIALAPDSLTVHSLAIKRASRLSKWIQENGVSALKNTDETMDIAAEGAGKLGMEPYYLYRQKNMSGNFENVGYARPGKFGLYNILIMEEKQTIVALGAGSISKVVCPDGRIERCENLKEVRLYMEKLDEMIARKEALFASEERSTA